MALAIEATSSATALESLVLQKAFHLRQIELIRKRKPKNIEMQGNHLRTDGEGKKAVSGGDEKPPQTEDAAERLYQTMEQCDSLLCYLNQRTKTSEKGFHLGNIPKPYHSAIKIKKDDKEVIEELRLHNESLRTHILSLLQECDMLKAESERMHSENKRLKQDLARRHDYRTSTLSYETKSHFNNQLHLDLGSLELPPLEIPKFDFDLLAGNNDTD